MPQLSFGNVYFFIHAVKKNQNAEHNDDYSLLRMIEAVGIKPSYKYILTVTFNSITTVVAPVGNTLAEKC